MSVSPTLQNYLNRGDIPYRLIRHPYRETSLSTAISAHVPARRMAKGVVLRDDEGFMMAVVPSDRRVDLQAINRQMGRVFSPAAQRDVKILFRDCNKGAVPALGQAYNMQVIWDDHLAEEPDCYMEAGDHEDLLCFSQSTFKQVMSDKPHGMISH
ncbi:MAG: YbaK/EbsC family protein [Amphritea sp.]|uniref:aminoacyl-tRNA deacylase n=1 Tax=Amphritea sp. TaxID=1872502 RepID=UPI001B6AC34D|nr:YbaK/EbsC family protein [Amphritea sp.]MBQ0756738.1 YbaK/EbsC family protein [Amphritea sp.]MBQ0782692.1 YbaK/EbsC family protein [Amphritea sp.]